MGKKQTMERSLLVFKESVKSKETYHTYLIRVNLSMKYHGIRSYDDILRRPNLQELFEDPEDLYEHSLTCKATLKKKE